MIRKQTISLTIDDEESRKQIRTLFEEIEQKTGVEGLAMVMYHSVLELVTNAVKANLKRAFLMASRGSTILFIENWWSNSP